MAEALGQVNDELPEVRIGSYPRLDAEDYRVMVTVESTDAGLVRLSVDRLRAVIPAERIVRIGEPE